MSNKDIEKDIKILRNITKQDFNNPMGWTGYYDSELKELQQAIKNILADRERYKKLYKRALSDLVVADVKANKYDRLVEKIKKDIEEYPEATYTKYYLLDCIELLKGEQL